MKISERAKAMWGALRGVTSRKALPPLSTPDRGWSNIWEWKPGAWQQDIEVDQNKVLANWAIYACVTLIASDISKLQLKLVEKRGKIWADTFSPAFSPVLKKPNGFQTRQKFIENWNVSKLTNGNAYILKERDKRGVVVSMYVLDPCRVQPLVAPNGDVYYRLDDDQLSHIDEQIAVPASEIIHDTMVCLFHPLVGVSPIYACGLAATQGLKIQNNSTKFFENMSRPSGILTTDLEIPDDLAKTYKDRWEQNYGGDNVGKVAVLGGGLKYQGLTVNAADSQMVEQLKMTAEMVCSAFHVPPFKIGIGTLPAGQKVADMNQIYYSDCLQALLYHSETLLDEGLGLDTPKDGVQLGTMFDLDDLLRMDGATMTNVLKEQVGAGITKIDEARERLNYEPTTGGNTPYLQQQNYSLEALAKRDAKEDPFGTAAKPAAPALPTPDPAKAIDVSSMTDAMAPLIKLTESLAQREETPAEIGKAIGEGVAEAMVPVMKQLADLAKRDEPEVTADIEELAAALIAKFTEATYAG